MAKYTGRMPSRMMETLDEEAMIKYRGYTPAGVANLREQRRRSQAGAVEAATAGADVATQDLRAGTATRENRMAGNLETVEEGRRRSGIMLDTTKNTTGQSALMRQEEADRAAQSNRVASAVSGAKLQDVQNTTQTSTLMRNDELGAATQADRVAAAGAGYQAQTAEGQTRKSALMRDERRAAAAEPAATAADVATEETRGTAAQVQRSTIMRQDEVGRETQASRIAAERTGLGAQTAENARATSQATSDRLMNEGTLGPRLEAGKAQYKSVADRARFDSVKSELAIKMAPEMAELEKRMLAAGVGQEEAKRGIAEAQRDMAELQSAVGRTMPAEDLARLFYGLPNDADGRQAQMQMAFDLSDMLDKLPEDDEAREELQALRSELVRAAAGGGKSEATVPKESALWKFWKMTWLPGLAHENWKNAAEGWGWMKGKIQGGASAIMGGGEAEAATAAAQGPLTRDEQLELELRRNRERGAR